MSIVIPIEVAAPIGAVLVGAVLGLWRQLIVERKEHREAAKETQQAHAVELEAERKRASESADEWRLRWKEQIEERERDTELFLRSLGRRPLTSSPPPVPIPRRK